MILKNRNLVWRSSAHILLFLSLLGVAAGCNMPVAQETDKPVPDLTQLVETVHVRLTQAVIATVPVRSTLTPSTVVLSSLTPTLTANSPTQTIQPGLPTHTQQALQACDQAGAGTPIDITIPDDTLMEPGQSFTKIWRLQNVGECTWSTSYRIFLFSGDPLGASNNIALSRQVSPGDSVDIAIDMVAPSRAGAFQGNWKLRNPDGMAFGIGPSASAPFWVRIVVEVTPTPTVTRTPTPTFMVILATLTPDLNTPTPSPTATGTPPTSLPLTLNPGDSLDFDSGELNSSTSSGCVV